MSTYIFAGEAKVKLKGGTQLLILFCFVFFCLINYLPPRNLNSSEEKKDFPTFSVLLSASEL